jgi:glutamyl-Q tRNA(Asp) synthetase
VTQPVFRFAPSPNGALHLGHALSALLNAQLAAEAGGRFLLRIEDIDIERCLPEHEERIFRDLEWLGLDWEKPVRRQSEHFAQYREALDRLIAAGLAYPAFMSRGEVRAAMAGAPESGALWPRDPDGVPLYPDADRRRSGSERRRRIAAGERYSWRLDTAAAMKAAGAELSWQEREEGTVRADPLAWGDVMIGSRDVPARYHLAVVVDDAAQGITDVVRGRDLYGATSVHRLLQTLLGLPAPRYFHHRLIMDIDGRKLSKSRQDTSLESLRLAGRTPADIRQMIGLD